MSVLAALLLAALPLAAGDEDPTEVLIRLRDQVLAHGKRIPNHTCVETIERDRFEPAGGAVPKSCDSLLARRGQANFSALLRNVTTDRLRLDVALAEGGEIYSWAGASKFEEGEIDQLIPDGAMGTGPFAAMLLGVFEGRPPRFTYEDETTLDHRLVFQYSYRVPVEDSHYRIKAQTGEWLLTGYTGTLWVDVKTAELIRLVVRTDELPASTSLCETRTTLDYGMVRLGGDDYLLPKTTTQRFIERSGGEGENRITFAACREYRGVSNIVFGENRATSEPAGAAPPPQPTLPPGLPVTIELETAIHGDRAAAGDRVDGRLVKPIRDAKGAVLVPEGAALEGRLMRVEIRHGARPETVLSLRWERIEIGRAKVAASLLPNRRIDDLKIGNRPGLRQRGIEIELPSSWDTAHGVFHFSGEHALVEAGYRTEWTTARPVK